MNVIHVYIRAVYNGIDIALRDRLKGFEILSFTLRSIERKCVCVFVYMFLGVEDRLGDIKDIVIYIPIYSNNTC